MPAGHEFRVTGIAAAKHAYDWYAPASAGLRDPLVALAQRIVSQRQKAEPIFGVRIYPRIVKHDVGPRVLKNVRQQLVQRQKVFPVRRAFR